MRRVNQARRALDRDLIGVLVGVTCHVLAGRVVIVTPCEKGLRERHNHLLRGVLWMNIVIQIYLRLLRHRPLTLAFVELRVRLVGHHREALVHGLIMLDGVAPSGILGQVEMEVDWQLLMLHLALRGQ